MGSDRAWESCSTAKLASSKVNGRLTLAVAEVWNATQTETDTKANF